MSTVIQKYKKLIEQKKKLELNHQFLDLALESLVRGRKNNRTSYNDVINKHYKKGITEKTELMSNVENLIEKRTKKIKETLSKLKENKKKLQKVKIELSNLCE